MFFIGDVGESFQFGRNIDEVAVLARFEIGGMLEMGTGEKVSW